MKKLYSKLKLTFNNLSLRSKLIVLLIIAGVIPLVFSSAFGYSSARDRAERQAYENLNSVSRQIANNIPSMLEPISQLSSLLYADGNLKAYLTDSYNNDIDYVTAYEFIDGYLYNILVSNGNIHQFTFYVNNQSIPADGFFVRHFDDSFPLSQGAYSSGTSELRYISPTQKKGVSLLLFGRPLDYGSSGEPYGYLIIAVRESALSASFTRASAGESVYIVDSGGVVISATDKSALLGSITDYIEDFPESTQSGMINTTVSGVKNLMVFDTLPNGWRTIVATPMDEVYGNINEATRQILFVSLVCIIVSLLVIFQISRYFSSRFALLNRQIHMVENNDFSFYVEPMGNDEIGKLSSTLNKMSRTLDNAINEVYKKEIQQKETELRLLQSQINPHFLYNALSGISTMALRSRDESTSKFAGHLSQFYKLSLNQGRQFVTISEEINITTHYIAIQETRFRDMFEFEWDIDDSVLEFMTPKLVLQPFIENIINHAFSDGGRPVRTVISIRPDKNDVLFTVCDDGAGISPETLDILLDSQKTHGYGLINVDARIKLSYGEKYGIELESALGQGTTARVRIPQNKYSGGVY